MMSTAKYGRMRFGRCIRKLYEDSGNHAEIGLCWRYNWSKPSLFRFCERILQLGDIQCPMQTRWGGHDDEGDLWKNEVWQMYQENLWWNLNSNRHRLLGEYYKVVCSIQISQENIATGRLSVHSANQNMSFGWPVPDTEGWSLEDVSGEQWMQTPRSYLMLVARRIL